MNGDRIQVVNGPTRAFDAREGQMRADARILRQRRPQPLHELPLLCASHNCGNVRQAGSRHCRKCDRILEQPVGKRSNPFSTAVFVCAVVGGLCALGYEFAPYVVATLKLWIGGLQ
jgi:hypothetical protein